jgi:hypothetical protein
MRIGNEVVPHAPETQMAGSEFDTLLVFVRERHQSLDCIKNVDDYAGGRGGVVFGNILADCVKVGVRFGVKLVTAHALGLGFAAVFCIRR